MNSAAIPSPGFEDIAPGPLTFHVYGLLYVVAVLAAVLLTRRRWRREGGDPDLMSTSRSGRCPRASWEPASTTS